MSGKINCPCCDHPVSQGLYPEYTGTCVTSDMEMLENTSINNRLCEACGLIFNAAGTRGKTEEFYASSYKLMMRNDTSGVQSFAGGAQPISQAERTFDTLGELAELHPKGMVLEAGAGKGGFLEHFTVAFPEWEIHAFEPSMAFEVLKTAHPDAVITQGNYTDVEMDGRVDLVVALGVLEHVENPLDMMHWVARQLVNGGIFYLRVPNFSKNPNDLFCADHLSKLTVPTLTSLAHAAGFEVIGHKEAGVPVFMALRKTGQAGKLANVYIENSKIASSNVDVAERAMDAILRCRKTANQQGDPFAIFGLGSSGLFSPLFMDFNPDEIAAYLDENKSVWGSSIHGRPVGGLDLIEKLGIKHIALAISPTYFDQVRAKLEPEGVSIYSA